MKRRLKCWFGFHEWAEKERYQFDTWSSGMQFFSVSRCRHCSEMKLLSFGGERWRIETAFERLRKERKPQ